MREIKQTNEFALSVLRTIYGLNKKLGLVKLVLLGKNKRGVK